MVFCIAARRMALQSAGTLWKVHVDGGGVPFCRLRPAARASHHPCILAQATGALVLPEGRQTRRSASQGELYVKTIALMVAPYVTHARQLYWRMQGVLGANFGPNWQKFAAFLACETANKQVVRRGGKDVRAYVSKDVPTKAEVLHAFKKGTCVFVSTEESADLLVHVAKVARAGGCRLLVIKDEAHFASAASASSTRLVEMVDPSKGDRAILATATPNADVMRFPLVMWPKQTKGASSSSSSSSSTSPLVDPKLAIVATNGSRDSNRNGEESSSDDESDDDESDDDDERQTNVGVDGYEHSFQMSIAEAIRLGYCADYKLILPQIFDISTGIDVPVKVSEVVKAHSMGNAAMMTVQAMHADGKRRCIAYADDAVDSANAAVAAIQSVCRDAFEDVYGIQCVAQVITHDIGPSVREARLQDFQFGPIETEPNEHGRCFPIFRFLVAVKILDQCIDLPGTDTVSILCPPTTIASVLSVRENDPA